MSRKLRLGVLFGGHSGEHEVSIVSARSVTSALNTDRYEIQPIGIDKAGNWLNRDESVWLLEQGGIGSSIQPKRVNGRPSLDAALSALKEVDVIFPVLHGPYGEDGTVQGLLDMAGVPYVGCGVAASALGMDKALQKPFFRERGLPVVNHRVVLRSQYRRDPAGLESVIEAEFGYPCFVKPANLGSSLGVVKVHSREELPAALDEAARYDRKILVEQAIDARELECSVLGNDEPAASVVGEIVPSHEFYDYEAKYLDTGSRLLIPAPVPERVSAEVGRLAVAAFRAIDGAGMARVDFFLDRSTERVFINEINTIPGFTSISMYPKLWEASGLGYAALLDRLIELALEAAQERGLAVPAGWTEK